MFSLQGSICSKVNVAAAKYVLLTEDGSEEHELVLESLVAFTWRPVWGGWNEAVL